MSFYQLTYTDCVLFTFNISIIRCESGDQYWSLEPVEVYMALFCVSVFMFL